MQRSSRNWYGPWPDCDFGVPRETGNGQHVAPHAEVVLPTGPGRWVVCTPSLMAHLLGKSCAGWPTRTRAPLSRFSRELQSSLRLAYEAGYGISLSSLRAWGKPLCWMPPPRWQNRMPDSQSACNVPNNVLGEQTPPTSVVPIDTADCGQLPPRTRRPALHHVVDPAFAVPPPRVTPMLRVTIDLFLAIASWWGKHDSLSCIRMCLYSSQQLLVVLHTAQCIRSVAAVTMPSPAAKLKAARRLPKRLRISGEAPQGDIARMREEATARYERGESSGSTLHSCLQRPRAQEASPSRPPPPKPPSPRRQRPAQVWKAKAEEVDKATEGTLLRATSPETAALQQSQSGSPEGVTCSRWQRQRRHCLCCRRDLGPS